MIFFSNRKTYLHLGACLRKNVLDIRVTVLITPYIYTQIETEFVTFFLILTGLSLEYFILKRTRKAGCDHIDSKLPDCP